MRRHPLNADFRYPERIAVGRSMPTDEPALGSQELNEGHLIEKRNRYLDEASAALAPSGCQPARGAFRKNSGAPDSCD